MFIQLWDNAVPDGYSVYFTQDALNQHPMCVMKACTAYRYGHTRVEPRWLNPLNRQPIRLSNFTKEEMQEVNIYYHLSYHLEVPLGLLRRFFL